MLKLKLQCFGHMMWRADSFEKTMMFGKIEGGRRRGQQRMKCLDGITNSMDMGLGGFLVMVMDREAWCAAIHGVTKSRTRQSDWTELNWHWRDTFKRQPFRFLCGWSFTWNLSPLTSPPVFLSGWWWWRQDVVAGHGMLWPKGFGGRMDYSHLFFILLFSFTLFFFWRFVCVSF